MRIYPVGLDYDYEIYNKYTKEYLVHGKSDDPYSPYLYDEYGFNKYFITQTEERKNKLKKLI